jgi:hypothetical protein
MESATAAFKTLEHASATCGEIVRQFGEIT